MDLHATLARLTRHPVFTEWHEKNKAYFLAHAFVMLDEPNKGIWQIGFYNSEKERMVTFIVSPDSVQHTEDQEVLKKEGDIKPLVVEEIKFSIEEALQKAKQCLEENYKAQTVTKQFFIIQNAEGHHLFNITYVTRALQTINIKIDAGTGEIFKHSSASLAEFT